MVEAVADYNFVASNDDELSIRRDDLLLVSMMCVGYVSTT